MKTLAKRLEREGRVGFEVNNHLLIRKMQLRERATRHELMVKGMLDAIGISYTFQKGFVKGGVMYIADFYLRKPYKIVLEIDGPGHNAPRQKSYDAARDAYWNHVRRRAVMRLTNSEVERMTSSDLMRLVNECRVRWIQRRKDEVCSENERVRQ